MGLCGIYSSECAGCTADKETLIADGEKGLLIPAPDIKTDLPDTMSDPTILINNEAEDVMPEGDLLDIQPEGTTEIENEAGAEETLSGMNNICFAVVWTILTSFCHCSYLVGL